MTVLKLTEWLGLREGTIRALSAIRHGVTRRVAC
jgi:hypothetical protein